MDRLDLTGLSVRTFYGHPQPGLALDAPGPGVNVVYGPNGQGKTTLARAIQGALWPELVEAHRPSYTAAFTLGEADWRVAFEAGIPRYTCDGGPSDRPPLPDLAHRDRYALSLRDLLLDTGTAFAEAIRREAVGGVDVMAAAERLCTRAVPSGRLQATAEAEEAARAADARRRELDALRAEADSLEDLDARAQEAADAVEEVELCRLVEEAVARDLEAAAAERAVAAFPDTLPYVAADTRERYDGLTSAVEASEAEWAEGEGAHAEARDALESHGWNAVALPEPAEREARARDLAAAEQSVGEAERAAAAAAAREGRAREALGAHAGNAASVDVAVLGDVTAFAQRAGRVRGRADELEGRRLAAKARLNAVRFHDAAELERGADRLRQWLAYTVEGEAQAPPVTPRAVWIGAAVVAVALGLTWTPGALWLLGGALALAAIAAALGRTVGRTESPSAEARQAYEATPLPTPAAWAPDAVKQTLDSLERRLLDQKERTLWAEAVAEIERAQLQTDAQREALDAEGAELAARLGMPAADTPEGLHLLALQTAAWQEADRERAAAEATLDAARSARADALRQFNDTLVDLPVEPATDAAVATARLAAVARESAERDRLREAVARHSAAVGEAAARRDTAVAARDRFLARLGLAEPAAEAVAALCAQHGAYTASVAEAARARTLAGEALAKARAHAGFDEALLDWAPARLAARRAEAEARAARRDAWIEQAVRIRERVEQARRSGSLAAARAEHVRALDVLEQAYDEQADALVGHALAEAVAEETRDHHLPQVFGRARDLFAEITAGRYRLEFDDEVAEFEATDALRGRRYRLDELSSGTRLQLLLAVRLAFAEAQERGLRVPLLLDEALATSDDERASAVADAVFRLCRWGRQAFTFTTRAEEVALWERCARAHPDVELQVAMLGGTAPSGVGESPAVPAPEGSDMDAYADALGVQPWSVNDSVEAAHVWYLLDTPDEVGACLRRGIETWGQLRDAVEPGAAAPVADVALAELRARALRAWRAVQRPPASSSGDGHVGEPEARPSDVNSTERLLDAEVRSHLAASVAEEHMDEALVAVARVRGRAGALAA